VKRKRFFLIDGFAHIFRAFYAIRNIDNNAVFGFTTMVRKLIADQQPDYIMVAFESPTPTFRKQLYPEYKANRAAPPEGLEAQIPLIKELIAAMNLPLIEHNGYEADDVIGTLAVKAAEQGVQAVIVSGDKDLLQLVKSDDIVVFDPKNDGKFLDEDALPDHFGCRADQIVDLLTIWGDSSDNVPGVTGVGEKGAKKLLAEYGTIQNIYEHLDEIKRKSYREGFEAARDRLDLTRELVTIKTDLNLDFDPAAYRFRGADSDKIEELFTRLNFKSLLKDLNIELKTIKAEYELLDEEKKLEAWLAEARKQKFVVFDLETTSLDPLEAEVVGVALALEAGRAGYAPLRHQNQDAAWTERAEKLLRALLADEKVVKCAHNAKYDMSVLMAREWDLAGVFDDTMLMSYTLNPTDSRHGLDALAESLLKYKTIHFEEVAGEGEDQVNFREVPIERAKQYAAEDADLCAQFRDKLWPEMEAADLVSVYETVERPLIPVLARMELTGVRVDVDYLAEMSKDLETRIDKLEAEIHELAGEEFNIKSTKQLGHILFEKMGLSPVKKTGKTKSYSTDQTVLEKLSAQGHELPARLLDYRMLTKLKSTYVDALPQMVHEKTGRVHSSFNQFVTATGRLSSNNPNLQNIPIRTELGREIRAAFVPEEGWTMIAADYSQIELRLMAHFSEDKTLIDSFQKGEDIHSRTASEIMDVAPDLVTPEMRAAAKSVNFGLIYGMGDFRLAQELNIPRKQARAYMETYFEKMPKVLSFRDAVIAKAKEEGEVRTFSGRRRELPEIKSRNRSLQQQGERLAVNTMIQGSAAEVIKLAMIELDRRLRGSKLKARLLLQVHDELVLECPKSETDEVSALLKDVMEQVVDFKVPLTVDVHAGPNWKEAK